MIPGVPVFAEPVLADQAPPGRLSGYPAFLLRSDQAGMYLADLTLRRRDEAALNDAPLQVLAEPVFTDPPRGGFSLGARQTLFFGSHTWIARADDTRRRNAVARPRLRAAANVTRTFPFFPEESRASTSTNGFLEIANDDRAYDWLPAAATIDGLPVKVYHGPCRGYFDSFDQRLFALGRSFEGRRDRVRIELQSDASPLLKPMAFRYYGGGGGPDGDPELAGEPVSSAYGFCFNVSLRRVSRAFEVWQAAQGPLQSFVAVKERGIVNTNFAGDFPSWGALVTASIPAFFYGTCRALGLVRFGTAPVGIVTADIQGFVFNGVWLSTLPDIADYLLRNRAGLPPEEIDRAAIFALGNQEAGFFTGAADLQVNDFFDEAARSIIGFHGRARDGRYRLKGVVAPERVTAPPPFPVPGVSVSPQPLETFVRSRQKAYYRRNWTVMGPADISEAVDDVAALELQSRGRSVERDNGSAAAYYPTAREGEPIDTLFTGRPGAEDACQTVIELFGIERDIFTVEIGRRGFSIDGGDVVAFATDRYGAGGKPFIVREIRERSEGESLALTVFGAAERLPST